VARLIATSTPNSLEDLPDGLKQAAVPDWLHPSTSAFQTVILVPLTNVNNALPVRQWALRIVVSVLTPPSVKTTISDSSCDISAVMCP